MGSTTALVTTGQALANTYHYDPWGQSIGTSGTTYNPFQFTGVYLDSATGLYRMTQRYYGPASSRFTQLDPLPKSILDVNRYAYAGCNPANYVDPEGLEHCGNATPGTAALFVGSLIFLGLAVAAIPATGGISATAAWTYVGALTVAGGSEWLFLDCLWS